MQYKLIRKFLLAISFLGCASLAYAQNAYNGNINYGDYSIERVNITQSNPGNVVVKMKINFSDINLRSTEMVKLTPKLVSADGTMSKEFNHYYIAGSNRYKVISRDIELNDASTYKKAMHQGIIFRATDKKRMAEGIAFSEKLPYEPWMKNAKLVVDEHYTGCAACDIAKQSKDLYAANLVPPTPQFVLNLIVPVREAVKRRAESMEAFINYENAKYDILPNYKTNAQEIQKVDDFMQSLVSEKNIKVSDFIVAGYASPLGGFAYNQRLSENRTSAFLDFLKSKYDLSQYNVKKNSYGEDWDGLARLVQEGSLSNKDQILAIIDKYSVDTQREGAIQKIDKGATYKILLDEYYPKLRRNTISAAYEIKNFTVEEAKEIYKTSPKLLSLNEMFGVAETYEPTSAEYMDVMRTATVIYPTDKIARMNYAVCLIKAVRPDDAITELNKLDQKEPEVLNIKGCALAQLKRYDEAKQCLKVAADKGVKGAQENLAEVERVSK